MNNPVLCLIMFLASFGLGFVFMMVASLLRKKDQTYFGRGESYRVHVGDYLESCDWHRGEDPLSNFEQSRCCRCDRYMRTSMCHCGSIFLDFTGYSPWAPQPTILGGDLMCSDCAEHAIDVEA